METLVSMNNYNGKLQRPIESGFDASTTAMEVIDNIDLSGKIAIVTGGNTGIGLETTLALASAGARVIVAARDIEKAKRNLQATPGVEIEHLDLINPASIEAFAEKFLASGRPLHLLVNNAGIMWVPLRRDSRGIESQFAINYLSQFRLTSLLWPALKAAGGARVINVSSQGHQFGHVDFDDPNFNSRTYNTLEAYGQSKTASNLFSVELDNRAKAFGVRSYSVHPGSVNGTELAREAPIELLQRLGFCDQQGKILPEVLASLKDVGQGAATTVWCATTPLLTDIGGVYCEDANIAKLSDDLSSMGSGVRQYSLAEGDAKRLWQLTENMIGTNFLVE